MSTHGEPVPATEARAQLADLINRVAYGGERIPLSRHGRVVAALVSADDLARLERAEGVTVGFSPPPEGVDGPDLPVPVPAAARHRQPRRKR